MERLHEESFTLLQHKLDGKDDIRKKHTEEDCPHNADLGNPQRNHIHLGGSQMQIILDAVGSDVDLVDAMVD